MKARVEDAMRVQVSQKGKEVTRIGLERIVKF